MTTQDLHDQQAKAKIKQLAESIDFTMLCTDLSSQPFHAIPMSTKRVDEEGVIWFLSGRDSTHNANILRSPAVQLIYSAPSSMQFLIVFGQASIVREHSILKSLYGKMDDAWFKGLDDPNLSAIRVVPETAHYWDVKGNRLVALWRMGVAAISGTKADIAEHGKLVV
jgi:general stress protein 26